MQIKTKAAFSFSKQPDHPLVFKIRYKNQHPAARLTAELHKSHERIGVFQFKIQKNENTLKFVIF